MDNSKVFVVGEVVRHIASSSVAKCRLSAVGFNREDIDINILSPAKVPISYSLSQDDGLFTIEFKPIDVGSYLMDIYVGGQKIVESPLYFKVYDSSLIRVSEVSSGIVGSPCQFRVDASQAGEGQLEISINDGEVPNHVQVLGGGRCLVHFTPEVAKTHTIDIKFNGEAVPGCPFVCKVTDTSKVSVSLSHLELMPVNEKATFHITVDSTEIAELAVSVTGPRTDLSVQVTGNVKNGFVAEFVPEEVGPYVIAVDYNNVPVGGTPFLAKAYDSANVLVSPVPWGTIGKSLEFTVDASKAGEGNLEITISAKGRNIPTQVHPQGSARFAVSFVALEAVDHLINVTFNKDYVPGAPFTAKIHTDPNHVVVSGQSLAATAVAKPSFFTLSNVNGSLSDIEVNIVAPSGESVPIQLHELGEGSFQVEFCPPSAGEHQIYVGFGGELVQGSPFACKVYNVSAIQVRECQKGIVGKPVTFLVETSQAGPGNLEVTVNNGQVPTSAQAQGNHTYAISFVPKESIPHVVELKFNSESVPGSPFKCMVVEAARVNLSGDGLEKVPVGRVATFFIDGQLGDDMGDPEVKILSPTRKVVPSSIRFVGEGHYGVDYTPLAVGDHQVEVKMSNIHVHGSPFIVKAYDASQVIVSNVSSGVVGRPVYFYIDASQAGAGNLEIIVSVGGKNVPNYVQSEGSAKFRVNFKPIDSQVHTVSVKFNNESVPNSPFECRIRDNLTNLSLSGPGLKMCPVGQLTNFCIDSDSSEGIACEVIVLGPTGVKVAVQMTPRPNGVQLAEFEPREVGPHSVKVLIDGHAVAGSPYTCNVYDVSKVVVAGLKPVYTIGLPITFTVDASQAGEGTLELVVTTSKASVRAEVQARSRGLYDVTFIPQEMISHFVNVTFNDEDVIGNPFECRIEPKHSQSSPFPTIKSDIDDPTVSGEGIKMAAVDQNAMFCVDTRRNIGEIGIRIVEPSGSILAHNVTPMQTESSIMVTYCPEMVGTHRVQFLDQTSYQERFLRPAINVDVFDPRRVKLSKIASAVLGQESLFSVNTTGAGRGALSVAIRAAGQEVRHSIRDQNDGKYEILFYPEIAVAHLVDIKYNGIPISPKPLQVQVHDPLLGEEVMATGLGLHQARVNYPASFIIETLGHNSREFDIIVTGPPDTQPPLEAVPVRCYQQKDGNLLAEFKSHIAGLFKVEVLFGGRQVPGSPFKCYSYDPELVELITPGSSTSYKAGGDPIRFRVQRMAAGFAELDVTVTSPLGSNLPIEVKGLPSSGGRVSSADLVEFMPQLAGKYKFVIKYGGVEVPGSPLMFTVSESMEATGGPKVYGKGLYVGIINEICIFHIDTKGLSGEPNIYISGPSTNAKTSIDRNSGGDSILNVKYIPQEIGVFNIQLHWNEAIGSQVPPNSFRPKICDPSTIVPCIPQGWNNFLNQEGFFDIVSNVENQVTFDVSGAGPGHMDADISSSLGPLNKPKIMHDGLRVQLSFVPLDASEHVLHILWNGIPINNSPLYGRARSISPTGNGGKVRLTGQGLARAVCGEENCFLIDGSAMNGGRPSVHLSRPETVSPINVSLRPLGGNIWQAAYVPTAPGTYMLNVEWGGRQVKGCPLKIVADSSAKAAKVLCSGDGLRVGTLGKDIRSFIDTRAAGAGELSLHCGGPHGKTAYCELNDHQNGTFTLNIKPQESGRHLLSIKYGGEHVPGSPYSLRVAGAPDPSRVRVYGPGIEHGVLAMYQSRFICDTRGAGAGQLTVRIRGPKGAFRVEMQRESQKDRTILCKYEPTEPGDYRIEIKWSGENVPGSPFMIMIFDTQDELSRFLQGNNSPRGVEMYGSIGPYSNYGNLNFMTNSWRGSPA